MVVVDKDLLHEIRIKGKCEKCRIPCQPEVHHLWTKGMGGGFRLDIRENLIALCMGCHRKFHNGTISRDELVKIVAKREGLTAEQVTDVVLRARNRRKPMQQYEFHPVVNLFPKASPEDRDAMLRSIKADGVHEPIWLWQGKLVDGRNRLEICQELEIVCPFEELEGDEETIVNRVYKRNALPRRNLTVTQRAAAAAGMIALMEQVGKRIKKDNLKQGDKKADFPIVPVGTIGKNAGNSPHNTREIVADAVGVSPRTVSRVAAIAKQADPEVMEALRDGVVTAGDAEQVIKQPKEKQRRAVRKVRERKAKTVKAAVQQEESAEKAARRTDARGRTIPDNLLYVVESENEAAALIDELHPYVARLNSLEKTMQRHLTWTAGMLPGFIRSLKDSLERLQKGFICPFCLGDEQDECLKCCRGQRWFTGEHARSVQEPK